MIIFRPLCWLLGHTYKERRTLFIRDLYDMASIDGVQSYQKCSRCEGVDG